MKNYSLQFKYGKPAYQYTVGLTTLQTMDKMSPFQQGNFLSIRCVLLSRLSFWQSPPNCVPFSPPWIFYQSAPKRVPLHYNAVFLPITTKTAFPFSRPKSTLAQRLLFYVVGQTVFTEMKPGHAKINILKRILVCPIWSRNKHCGKKWSLYYNNMK